MEVSVCMATCNGAVYLEEQLRSICRQTRLPDEIVITDDVSVDGTPEILYHYRELLKKKGCLVRRIRNTERKGYPGNFYYAASLCTKDILFFADQDDLWRKDKIERMAAVFEEREDISLLCSRFLWIDEDSGRIRSLAEPVVGRERGGVSGVLLNQVLRKCEWPGMTLACRRDWYEKVVNEEIRNSGIPHDLVMVLKGAEEGSFYRLDRILACHRIHKESTSGEIVTLRERLFRMRKTEEIRTSGGYLRKVQKCGLLQTAEGRRRLHRKLCALEGRYLALDRGDRGMLLKNAWEYRETARIPALLCDLLVAGKKSGSN